MTLDDLKGAAKSLRDAEAELERARERQFAAVQEVQDASRALSDAADAFDVMVRRIKEGND